MQVNRPRLVLAASTFLLGAGAAFFASVQEQLHDFGMATALFLAAVAVADYAFTLVLLTIGRRLLALAGAGLQVVVIVLWIVGPGGLQAEPPGLAGIFSVEMEVLAAILLVLAVVLPPVSARALARRRWLWGFAAAALTALSLGGLGVAAAGGAEPPAINMSTATGDAATLPMSALTARSGDEPVKQFTLVAETARIRGTNAYTFDGTVPGPELRVTQGDRIRATLMNHLPVATTIHWHGLMLPNADDGVPGVTQDAVPPGGTYTYEFVASNPGTYWYHSHQNPIGQISAGLFGALVVEPRQQPAEAHDYVVMLHTTPDGDEVAANGVTGDLHLDAAPGETVRLRLVDAVNASMDGGPQAPVLFGAPYRVVALDGHDLNEPGILGPQRLVLGMGRRIDLVLTMPASGAVRLVAEHLKGAPSLLEPFFGTAASHESVTVGTGALPATGTAGSVPVFDLTRYGQPAPDPVTQGRFDVTYPVDLTESPGVNNLVGPQLGHYINGRAQPMGTMFRVNEGQVVRLHMVNETAEWHTMHLHGHLLSVISVNGRPLRGSPVHLDTVPVAPYETWDVAFLADNPGLWMLHCHVLLHAWMGMSAMVVYSGVHTPYSIGTRSGNDPQ